MQADRVLPPTTRDWMLLLLLSFMWGTSFLCTRVPVLAWPATTVAGGHTSTVTRVQRKDVPHMTERRRFVQSRAVGAGIATGGPP